MSNFLGNLIFSNKHLPKTHLSLAYVTALSLKYSQSSQPNSQKCIMLDVSPFMTVLGTSPLRSKTLFAVHDLISISNSEQSSHNFFGELDLIIVSFSTFLQLSNGAFCCILACGIWFSLLHMATCFCSLMPEFTHNLFCHSIHYQSAWDPLFYKQE